MAIKNLNELKARFESGDIPTGQDFVDLIDTLADLNAFWPEVLPEADAGNLTNLPLPNPLPALDARNLFNVSPDEYNDLSLLNPSYADATSFTVTGDQVDMFLKTRRLRLTVDGVNLYTSASDAEYDDQADATVVTIIDQMPSNQLDAVGVSIFTPFTYGGAITPEMIGVTQNYNPTPTNPPSMAITIGAGRTFDGVAFTQTEQSDTPIFTSPAENPRIDRVAVNRTTGNIEIIEGTEDADPIAPSYSGNHYPVCRINLAPGMTEITASEITTEFSAMSDKTSVEPSRLPNAGSTEKGAIKVRLDGSDLYITSDGSNP